MRSLLIGLAGLSMMLSVVFAVPAPASEREATPSAATIEKLLRDWLAKDEARFPPLAYRTAELVEFELVDLDQLSPSRWDAEIELLFDFGAAPPAVVGFERMRRGRFRMLLNRQDERLGVLRFNPLARVHPLPVRR